MGKEVKYFISPKYESKLFIPERALDSTKLGISYDSRDKLPWKIQDGLMVGEFPVYDRFGRDVVEMISGGDDFTNGKFYGRLTHMIQIPPMGTHDFQDLKPGPGGPYGPYHRVARIEGFNLDGEDFAINSGISKLLDSLEFKEPGNAINILAYDFRKLYREIPS